MADLTKTLARQRVPLGFAFAGLVIWLAEPTAALLTIGSLVAAAGEGLRLWAAGHLNKSREVTASGPYQLFAHPLYVGSSVMGIGLAIASGSLAVAVLIAIYLSTTIAAAVRSEETFLRQKFGAEYERYRRGEAGPRDSAASSRRFSMTQAMANREYRALGGVVLAVVVLAAKAAYNGGFLR